MSTALALTVGMARSWVALYTVRLPNEIREARRSEIDSDLWEQQWLAARRGDPPFGTAIEVLARMLLGIISDITWRAQAGALARPDRGIQMNEAPYMRGLVVVGLVLALFPVIIGVGSIFNDFKDGDNSVWLGGSLTAISGAAMAVGLLISRRNPLFGIGLVVMGVITIGFVWTWMLVTTIPIGIAIVAIAFFRSKQTGWPRRPGTDLPTGTGAA